MSSSDDAPSDGAPLSPPPQSVMPEVPTPKNSRDAIFAPPPTFQEKRNSQVVSFAAGGGRAVLLLVSCEAVVRSVRAWPHVFIALWGLFSDKGVHQSVETGWARFFQIVGNNYQNWIFMLLCIIVTVFAFFIGQFTSIIRSDFSVVSFPFAAPRNSVQNSDWYSLEA